MLIYVIKLVYLNNAEKLLEEVDFPKELVINYHEDEIKKFFNL